MSVVATAAMGANAQTEKGTLMLGGSAGFSSTKVKGMDASTSVEISPTIGYFVGENIAVGAGVSVQSVKDVNTTFGIGPFVRYYFLPIGTNAKLFGHANFGFMSSKDKGASESDNATTWGIAAGPAFFLNPSIALEATLGFQSLKFKDVDAINSFGLSVGFQIHFKKGGKK